MKIVSGGQTGVDRAALDVALKHGLECGGWCPAGRWAEDGAIPARYPVRELPGAGVAERTRQNVSDSDATVIFCGGEPRGGTAVTIRCCQRLHRSHIVIDASQTDAADAVSTLNTFLRDNAIDVLNIAGPRASEWPDGYDYAARVLERLLSGSCP